MTGAQHVFYIAGLVVFAMVAVVEFMNSGLADQQFSMIVAIGCGLMFIFGLFALLA